MKYEVWVMEILELGNRNWELGKMREKLETGILDS